MTETDVEEPYWTAMMAQGEDAEEFFARLLFDHANPEFGNEAGDLQLLFGWHRREYLDGCITAEQRADLLGDLIDRLLKITGPVEPSAAYVGYF